jgi:hypothetical protein
MSISRIQLLNQGLRKGRRTSVRLRRNVSDAEDGRAIRRMPRRRVVRSLRMRTARVVRMGLQCP